MSQAGIVDFEGSHPAVPTSFVTNSGTAVPIANTLELLGATVAAHSIPLETTGSGNTVTVVAQYASAAASSVATNAGFASFNSAFFTVDANGFVSFSGSAATESFTVDAFTAPGTNPVAPNGSGNVTITGAQVAAGVVGAHVIRTDSLAANQVIIEIQRTAAVSSSNSVNNGVSHFSNEDFQVDANGFVTLAGSLTGTATTVGAVTANLFIVTLDVVPATYQFQATISAFNAFAPASAGYSIFATIRTDGTTATLVGNQAIYNEDTALEDANAYFTVSGNTAILQVLGVTGLTIDWAAKANSTAVN